MRSSSLDGLILTKLDSDTRGGALLSAKVITGKPVKFLASARTRAPRRIPPRRHGPSASWAWATSSPRQTRRWRSSTKEETARMQAKAREGQFSFEDFIKQMQQIKKLGPIGKIMGMIPGMSDLAKGAMMNGGAIENQMKKIESIYNSMTKEERKNPTRSRPNAAEESPLAQAPSRRRGADLEHSSATCAT